MGNLATAHYGVLERIAQAKPLGDVLGSIVDMVEAEADDVLCSILLYDAREQTLHHGATSRLPRAYVDAIEGAKAGPGEGSCGAAAYLGTPVVVADISTHPNWARYRALALPHGLRSCWSTPIKAPDGEVLGTFAMYHKAPGLPGDTDFEAVEMATHAAAIAIMRTRFDDSLRQSESRARQLARLYAVSSAINEAIARVREPSDLYDIACQIAVEKGLARLAWICTYETELSQLRAVARFGHDEGYVDALVDLLGTGKVRDGFIARALYAGESTIVNDIEAAPEFAFKELALAHGLASLAVFPLDVDGSTRGVLAIGAASKEFFQEEEVDVLTALAADLSFAVQSAIGQRRREEAESLLAEKQALLAIAGRAARLGGILINLNPWRVALSDEACAMAEVEPGTSLTQTEAFAFFHPEHRKPVMQAVWSAAQAGRPFDVEFEAVTKSGRSLWFRVVGDAVRGEAGEVVQIQAALQDVTERRKLEHQFRQAQKMDAVGTLAGGVAHDFNNILSVILSYCQLAAMPLEAESPARADLHEIEVAARRASELTRQLLAFSRQGVMKPRVLDVNEVVFGMEKMLGRLVGADVEVSVSKGSDLGKVFADRGQIEQVLMNLVVNARDAMPRGGKVIIETTNVDLDVDYAGQHVDVPAGPYVQLAVSDSGTGMDAATRERIFEPFFTTKEQGKGTGLGLSTVWGIVKQSGGHIWVYSEPGVGTTFKLYLPRVDREVDQEVERRTPTVRPRGNETVLLVEDDPQLRAIAARVLKEQGYAVLQSTNGADALVVAEMHDGPIQLLLTDVVMPRMNGFELVERLRSSRPELKVLIVSGYTHEAIKRRETAIDDFEFLPKPLTPDALLLRVRGVLDG